MTRILCAVLVLLVAASPAEAATFKGRTNQGRSATVIVGDDGLVTQIRIGYIARCGKRRSHFTNVTQFAPAFRTLSPVLVSDHATFSQPLRGGGRTRQTASVVAHLVDGAWQGTFHTRAVLRRDGRRLDTCQVKKATWSASMTFSA